MRAFLGYCGGVDHQHGIAAADQPIRLNKQFRRHRPRIPDPGRNEVVQLIVFAKPKPLRHRLNALTSARTDQPRHVEWTHLSPRLVTQPIQKRLEKASKLFFPIRRPSNHGRPLQSRPPMSHRKTDLGIPCPSKSPKVVLVPVAGHCPDVVHPRIECPGSSSRGDRVMAKHIEDLSQFLQSFGVAPLALLFLPVLITALARNTTLALATSLLSFASLMLFVAP